MADPAENRARFLTESDSGRCRCLGKGPRWCPAFPSGTFNGMSDSNPEQTFSVAIRNLEKLGIAYVHLVEGLDGDARHGEKWCRRLSFSAL